MDVQAFQGIGFECNSYLVRDKKCILVDVGTDQNIDLLVKSLMRDGSPDRIDKIVLTHTHFDHAGGANRMSEITGAEIFVHPSEGERMSSGDLSVTISRLFSGNMDPFDWKPIDEGSKIDVGSTELSVLHLPGHSEGSIGLWHEASRSLIAGDTVFADGGIGRYDLPTGDFVSLKSSISRLAGLKVKNLYPGHGRIVLEKGHEHIVESLGYVSGGAL
ncbi:MAG: MBL fold metallo-hydrolase [Thermoplasmata archaeon]|nr:MBL fold metallo-hydrolase [Thermoplasmata archaeon]